MEMGRWSRLWHLLPSGLLALMLVACGGGGDDKPVEPTLEAEASFSQQNDGLTVTFDAGHSSGAIASYLWDFGDGSTGTGKSTSHRYAVAGSYTVILTVSDEEGATARQTINVSVLAANQLPTASFSVQANRLVVQLDGSASTDADGHLVGYRWSFGEPSVGGENQSAEQKPQHSYQATGTYTVTLTVTDDRGGEHSLSRNITVLNPIAAVATGKLNDTGMTGCADASSWSLPCPVAGFPGQDAESGRDVSANDDSDGRTGFSFTKVSSSGEALPATASEWHCVKDNVTGLLWELHTNDGGLRDKNNTYSWYNPVPSTNGGDAGIPNGGSCSGGISCDTQSYVAAVNAAGLCGYHDWRLPTSGELLGLVDFSIPAPGPAIDVNYFFDTSDEVLSCASYESGLYWTSSAAAQGGAAWSVGFCDAKTYAAPTHSFFFPVRLVRSEP